MAAISLNGTSFTPSDIQTQAEKIGATIQAANGARRWAHRADKRTWTITWALVPLATLTAVRGIFALTATFAFVDENGASVTVLCQEGALTSNVSAIAWEGGAQVLYYDISLTVVEA